MNAYLAAAILLQAVRADWSGDVQTVSSDAAGLASAVSSWSSGDGLPGALGIQESFGPLSSAVDALSGDAGSLSASDVDVDATNSLASAVSSLLSALVDKASDFKGVGASSIVAGDIQKLQGPTADIVSSIVAAVSGDSDKVGSLTSALAAISNGFGSADSAYGVSTVAWPTVPTGGSSGGSSAAKSSGGSGSSSAAETSAASSAAKSSGGSGAKSSAASSVAAGSSSAKPPATSNGGNEVLVGLGAAVAGVAALLI